MGVLVWFFDHFIFAQVSVSLVSLIENLHHQELRWTLRVYLFHTMGFAGVNVLERSSCRLRINIFWCFTNTGFKKGRKKARDY